MAEEYLPEKVKTYHERRETAESLFETKKNMHDEVYQKVVVPKITDKNKKLKHERLKDEDFCRELGDKMADEYLRRMEEETGRKVKGKDEHEKQLNEDMALMDYAGTTRADLKKKIATSKNKFTKENYMKSLTDEKEGHLSHYRANLHNSAAAHFDKEDISDILKYTGTDKYLDKKKMSDVREAVALLEVHDKGFHQFTLKELQKGHWSKYLNDKSQPKKYKSPHTKKKEGFNVQEDLAA